jgi:transposase-like protein
MADAEISVDVEVGLVVDPQPAEIELDYLYLDGTAFATTPAPAPSRSLVAHGITTCGSPVFLGLDPAASDGHDPWVDFLGDLSARGLRPPLLVITDGAPGLLSAVEQAFPATLRQRRLVHRSRKEMGCRFRLWGLLGWYARMHASMEVREQLA